MGREAVCHCQWGGESAECKVLLETDVLLTRGALRRKAAIASIVEAHVDGEQLRFRVGDEAVALRLGEKQAQSWLKKLTSAPVSLAGKLGMKDGMRVMVLGDVISEALREALAGVTEDAKTPEVVVLCADSPEKLEIGLRRVTALSERPAVWVIYRKGARAEAGEGLVRERMRETGWIDTKVASVDAAYTGLKFVRRKD